MTRTHNQWIAHFMPEGREHVRRRLELGEHIADEGRAVRCYASFCAFDAIHKGFEAVDFKRARNIANAMSGQHQQSNVGRRAA